jgi:hypothetical protein
MAHSAGGGSSVDVVDDTVLGRSILERCKSDRDLCVSDCFLLCSRMFQRTLIAHRFDSNSYN